MKLERFVDSYNEFCAREYGDPRCEEEQLSVHDVSTIYPKVNILYTEIDYPDGECEIQVDYDTIPQELVVYVLDKEYRESMPIREMTLLLEEFNAFDDILNSALSLLEKKGFLA